MNHFDLLHQAPFLELGALLEPIDEANPAGPEARDDERHELVRAELQKLSGLSPATPDWSSVVRAGHGLLTQRSKDLTVACDVTIAMFACGGLAEGTRGLLLVAGLLLRFEGLHPMRTRARAGALQTLMERASARLANVQPTRESLDALISAVRFLDQGIQARLGPEGPSTRPLRDAAEKLAQRCPAPSPPVEKQPDPPAPVPLAPSSAPRSPTALSPQPPQALLVPVEVSAAPLGVRLQTLSDALIQTAHSMRTGDSLPSGFIRVLMTGLYLPLVEAPPTRLALSSPRPFLDAASALQGRGDHLGCVEHILRGLAPARFALDAYRLAFTSLDALGYVLLRDEVETEVRALVRRHPSLFETTFRDGPSVMSEETRAWVQAGPRRAIVAQAPSREPQGGVDDGLAEATALTEAGQLREAMQSLEGSVARASTGLLRFSRSLALAELSESLGAPLLSETLFGSLYEEAEQGQLHQWDPELFVRAARGLYRALACKNDGPAKERAGLVLRALIRTAPSAALEILKPSPP